MKIYKIPIIITLLLLFVPAAYAAEDTVIFYPATKILSVAGQCEKKDVLILIYYADTDKIWGSGNVRCQDGQYQYRQNFNDWKISDGEFEVEIFDGGYKAKKESQSAEQPREKVVVEGMNLKNAAALTSAAPEDDNSLIAGDSAGRNASASGEEEEMGSAEAGVDNFSLNSVLGFFFGIVQDIGDAIQNFAVVIAKTIKTTTLAAIKIFAKDLAIVPDGKISVPAGENQLSGRAVILAGTAQVKINNNKITGQSKIFLTPLSEINLPLAIIEKADGQSFTAGMSQIADKDIAFDWFIIESYAGGADGGNSENPSALPSQDADEDINFLPDNSSLAATDELPVEPQDTEETATEENKETQAQLPAENSSEAEVLSEADNSTSAGTASETAQ